MESSTHHIVTTTSYKWPVSLTKGSTVYILCPQKMPHQTDLTRDPQFSSVVDNKKMVQTDQN